MSHLAAAVVLAIAALSDLLRLRIPNACSLALVLLFAVAAAGGELAWRTHLLGGAVGLAGGLVAFACGWVGAGDAKLLAAVALWCGLRRFPALLMAVGLAGGVLAVMVLVARRCRLGRWLSLPCLAEDAPLPYGLAIAGAAIWMMAGLP